MRKLLLIAGLPLFLAACSSTAEVTYDLKIGITDGSQRSEVVFGAVSVIERRLARLAEDIISLDVHRDNGEEAITVIVNNKAALDILTQELTEEFDLQIMVAAGVEDAEVTVEGHGGFKKSLVNGSHIEWMNAAQQADGLGRITITFTPEGRELMGEIFADKVGESIGLFVRETLVSKLAVSSPELKDDIVISDIPSAELATIFADDVNVGLHVTFVPSL